jgi:putative transposase
MDVSPMKRLKELEAENAKLKKMFAEQALQIEMAKDVISNLPTYCEQSGK